MSKSTRYLLRIAAFIFSGLLIIILLIVAGMAVFFSANHTANIDIVISEGMKTRAAVILHKEDDIELTKYFALKAISNDKDLTDGKYSSYTINTYNHKVDFPLVVVMPWDRQKEVYVKDSVITLKGTVTIQSDDKNNNELPKWKNGVYKLTIVRDGSFWDADSRWLISDIEFTESIEIQPIPTPGPNTTIIPQLTPTPTPTHSLTPGLPASPVQ